MAKQSHHEVRTVRLSAKYSVKSGTDTGTLTVYFEPTQFSLSVMTSNEGPEKPANFGQLQGLFERTLQHGSRRGYWDPQRVSKVAEVVWPVLSFALVIGFYWWTRNLPTTLLACVVWWFTLRGNVPIDVASRVRKRQPLDWLDLQSREALRLERKNARANLKVGLVGVVVGTVVGAVLTFGLGQLANVIDGQQPAIDQPTSPRR